MGDDIPSLLALAAGGDCDAQGILRDELLMEIANVQSDYTVPILLAQAEVFARLAATQGRADDLLKLVVVLVTQAEVSTRDARLDEAERLEADARGFINRMLADHDADTIGQLVVSMTELADRGNEIAALLVGQIVAALPRHSAATLSASASAIKAKMEA